MASETAAPPPEDIKSQLDRMLASKRFKAAPNQAAFLAFVVNRALAGKKTSENVIGRKLFGEKFHKDESPDVRVTAINLRKKLSLYFANEGREDPFMILLPTPPSDKKIKLPEGEAYRPMFSYNANSKVARELRLGQHFLSPKRPFELANAMEHFKRVAELAPTHVGAFVGTIEAACLLAWTGSPSSIYVSAAIEVAPKAIAAGPKDWHAHAAAGAAWMLSGDSDRATSAFRIALELDRSKLLVYGWYHAFLLATGRCDEAVSLARLRAESSPEDAMIQALYAAYLYANREFQLAHRTLFDSIELDRNCWFAHLIMALNTLTSTPSEHPHGALVPLRTMDHCLQSKGYFLPGLAVLIHASLEFRFEPDALSKARNMFAESAPCYTQLALFFQGVNEEAMALTCLAKARQYYEPAVLFLNHLPIFDRIRDHPEFDTIARRAFADRPLPPSLSEPSWRKPWEAKQPSDL